MAKLNAPLFSFNASGQLAKALVYFGWKGINVVRSYVVPTNPDSADQQTQRGYFKAAVALIHAAQALAADPLDAADQIAYSLYGSKFPTPRTWFNTIVKNIVDTEIAGNSGTILCNGAINVAVTEQLTFTGDLETEYSTEGTLFWGLTKTSMPNSVAANVAAGAISAVASPTVVGKKYFLQWKANSGTPIDGAVSGIYTAVST